MTSALLAPVVAGVMAAASTGTIGFSAKASNIDGRASRKTDGAFRLSPRTEGNPEGDGIPNRKKAPLMAVMGAAIFACQMINFTIPGTGSSGHIVGGILLAAVLGTTPAALTMAGILLVQCLFFADGGLLAYGANVFNMAVIPCLIVFPLLFKRLAGRNMTYGRIALASIVTTTIAAQLGAFAVLLETFSSGITELPITKFAVFMQPIHLAIGLGEGIITAGLLCMVKALSSQKSAEKSPGRITSAFGAVAIVSAGILSLFASQYPDGLEWSIAGTAGEMESSVGNTIFHGVTDNIQSTTSLMPDYVLGGLGNLLGTSAAGLIGSAITMALVGLVAVEIYKRKKNPQLS
jgi:cobalt/nickel transport system permease protein